MADRTSSICNSDGSSLDSIKLVLDNLSERVKLDCSNTEDCYDDEDILSSAEKYSRLIAVLVDKVESKEDSIKFESNWTTSLKLLEQKIKSSHVVVNHNSSSADESKTMTDMTMNSNLMFRSMFFMNDEATRHFLAPPLPPIQPCDIQSEYFQKKLASQGTSAPGPSSVTTSSAATGNISTQTVGTCPSPQQQPQQVPTNSPADKSQIVGLVVAKTRPHTCEECGKTFLMKHHLSTHLRIHSGERPHICPECGKSFALKHCLSTHLLLHTADRPYKCLECNKSFTLKHHLVSHERVHTRERPFECPECGQRFAQKRHLSTHIKFHSGERPFSCQVCGESFSREEHLVMHSRFHGGLSPYNCPDCGAGFLRKFELVNHERQHGRNPESCPNCGKEFLQKRTLLVHVRSCGSAPSQQPLSPSRYSDGSSPRFNDNNTTPQFSDGSSPRFTNESNSPRFPDSSSNQFRFPEGSMRFSNGTPSTSPMPTMSTQVTKDKVCKECGETFASMEGLALHLRLHFGDHSFLADICSLAASLKQTAVNVAVSLKKTHICPDCGRGFTQRHGLFQHRQRHTNGSCKEKPFACEKCGKSFAQKNHLTLHERQHMDHPRTSVSKNMVLKGSHSSADSNQMEDQPMESSSGENSQRSCQGEDSKDLIERVMTNQMMLQQNHSDHQRVDLMNRHESSTGESSQRTSQVENRKSIEQAMANSMMLQQNHPDHHRIDLMNRHQPDSSVDESSQRSSQNENRKDIERVLGNPMMLQQTHQDLMSRHGPESSTGESGPRTSQSENRKDIERVMANPMLLQQSLSDRQRVEVLNRHSSESQRSLNSLSRTPLSASLVRMQNIRVSQDVNSSDRPMLPPHLQMSSAPTSEHILPCLHPVPSKQY